MVWATTTKLGCGLTEYRLGSWRAKYYVCNYGEGGNLISSRVYTPGYPCSRWVNIIFLAAKSNFRKNFETISIRN